MKIPTRSRRLPNITQLFEKIRDHGLDTVPRIARLMKWVDIEPRNQTLIELLMEAATDEFKKQRLNPDPFRKTTPRENHHLNGAIQLEPVPAE